MADRNRVSGPYQAMAEEIETRKKSEAAQRSPVAREPVVRRFTPLSPEGPVGRVPRVGPAAGPSSTMGAALGAPERFPVPRATGTSPAQPVAPLVPRVGHNVVPINVSPAPAPASSPANDIYSGEGRPPVVTEDWSRPSAAAPVAAVPATRAGYDQSEHVMWTPGMSSVAAMNLRRQMAQETGATMSRDYRKFGGMSARGQQLQSQWDEAARAAFTGAMTPQQQAAWEREQAAERMRQGAAFRESPQYQMGEQAGRTAIGVAGEQARGMIGASATKAEQDRARLAAEAANTKATLESQEKIESQRVGEQRAGRTEVAEENRKSREVNALGEQIARLYATFEKIPDGTPAAKSLADRIAKLEAQYDKMLGISAQEDVGGRALPKTRVGPGGVTLVFDEKTGRYVPKAG